MMSIQCRFDSYRCERESTTVRSAGRWEPCLECWEMLTADGLLINVKLNCSLLLSVLFTRMNSLCLTWKNIHIYLRFGMALVRTCTVSPYQVSSPRTLPNWCYARMLWKLSKTHRGILMIWSHRFLPVSCTKMQLQGNFSGITKAIIVCELVLLLI